MSIYGQSINHIVYNKVIYILFFEYIHSCIGHYIIGEIKPGMLGLSYDASARYHRPVSKTP